MSAKLFTGHWGWGGLALAPADMGGAGGGAAEPVAEAAGAAEASARAKAADEVFTLSGDFAEDKPDVGAIRFPGPIAEAYYWDDERVVGIVGPVGSGKTTTKMMRKARRAFMMPRSSVDGVRRYRVLFVRETYRQLWSSVIPSYLKVFPRAMGQWSGGRGDPVRHFIVFEDEFGVIEFEALFMAFGDSVGESLRGIEVTDLDISEADTNPIDTLTFGIGRVGRYPESKHFVGYPPEMQAYGQIDCDFNAPDEDMWTYRVFYDEDERRKIGDELTMTMRQHAPKARAVRITFYRQPGYGEPGTENLANLPPGYYEAQIALNRLAGRSDVTERMVYNRVTYLRAGDPVFKAHFNRRAHVSDGALQPVPTVPLLVGLDQGFKGAAVVAQWLEPGRWRILAELHFPTERLFAADFGQRLADLLDRRFPGMRVECGFGDMAGEAGAAQAEENATWNRNVAKAAGFRIRPQLQGANRLQPRLEAVRAALDAPLHHGQPGLLIDPSCRMLIRGFEARYVWKDEVDASGDKRKVPDKSLTEANVMDALQYLLLSKHRRGSQTLPDGGTAATPGPRGRMAPEPAGGLVTGYDVLNPYGG